MREVDGGPLIIAVDPGLVTGMAVFHVPTGALQATECEGRHHFYEVLNQAIGSGYPPEVVCESYVITARSAQVSAQYDALYIIGHLDAVCHRLGIPLTLQSPGQAKSFSSDSKLKRLGWWNPTPGGHANDALRHLLRYIVRQHPAVGKSLLAAIREEDA